MQDRHRALPVVLRSVGLLLAVSLIGACSDDKQIARSATSSTALSSTTSTSTPQLTTTAIVHVRPVDDQGRLRDDFRVVDTVDDAKCLRPSVKVNELANSCGAGEFIYDPCWTETDGPSGPSVICMTEPWNQNVNRLLTGRTIAPAPGTPGGSSWGVELADGQRCRVSTGAHDSLNPSGGDDADVVDYYCGEALGLVLLRGFDKTRPVWTARAARYVGDHYERVDPQTIATALF